MPSYFAFGVFCFTPISKKNIIYILTISSLIFKVLTLGEMCHQIGMTHKVYPPIYFEHRIAYFRILTFPCVDPSYFLREPEVD